VVTTGIDDDDGLAARREAVLRPRVVREFLQKYDGAKMPREDVALKVLQGLQVPSEALQRAWSLISDAAKVRPFLKEINGVQYVDIRNPSFGDAQPQGSEEQRGNVMEEEHAPSASEPLVTRTPSSAPPPSNQGDPREKRVFVTHGKNREFIPQIKELLDFGKFEPVVSIERESVSKPVPDKVMDDMRSCGAAIIHVDADREVMTQEGEKESC